MLSLKWSWPYTSFPLPFLQPRLFLLVYVNLFFIQNLQPSLVIFCWKLPFPCSYTSFKSFRNTHVLPDAGPWNCPTPELMKERAQQAQKLQITIDPCISSSIQTLVFLCHGRPWNTQRTSLELLWRFIHSDEFKVFPSTQKVKTTDPRLPTLPPETGIPSQVQFLIQMGTFPKV